VALRSVRTHKSGHFHRPSALRLRYTPFPSSSTSGTLFSLNGALPSSFHEIEVGANFQFTAAEIGKNSISPLKGKQTCNCTLRTILGSRCMHMVTWPHAMHYTGVMLVPFLKKQIDAVADFKFARPFSCKKKPNLTMSTAPARWTDGEKVSLQYQRLETLS